VLRDPLDSCFAIYKTLFAGAYPFAYDLRELGQYYCAWNRLVRHWQRLFGSAMLTVRYEDLVSRQEAVTRDLLGFCGLKWQPSCLNFHASTGAVATASATQVRRPLYASSVGLWRRYEKHLGPLQDCLRRLAKED